MSKKKARSQEVKEAVASEATTAEPEIEVTATSTEATSAETSAVQEKPAKQKRNTRPYLDFATDALSQGLYTRKDFVAAILAAFPEMKKGAIDTFVTDLKNPKYCYFKPRLVVVNADGKLIFEDAVEAAESGQAETEPIEVADGTQTAEVNEPPLYHTTM